MCESTRDELRTGRRRLCDTRFERGGKRRDRMCNKGWFRSRPGHRATAVSRASIWAEGMPAGWLEGRSGFDRIAGLSEMFRMGVWRLSRTSRTTRYWSGRMKS
jgi:hypothetical protein